MLYLGPLLFEDGKVTDLDHPEPEGCHAARTGEGYWTCDVPGGCSDCRALAREIDDTDQIAQWSLGRP